MLKSLLSDYLSAWNRRDVDAVMSYFDDAVEYEDVALKKVLDRHSLRDFVAGALVNSPDLRFELISVCEGEGQISWEWLMHRSGPEGEATATPGQSMTVISHGKIVRNRDYWSRLPV